jgi:hypothetical protein
MDQSLKVQGQREKLNPHMVDKIWVFCFLGFFNRITKQLATRLLVYKAKTLSREKKERAQPLFLTNKKRKGILFWVGGNRSFLGKPHACYPGALLLQAMP